jgi:prepilin-type processing-associated H-X9-DG protein
MWHSRPRLFNQRDVGIPSGLAPNLYASFKYPWTIQILPHLGNNRRVFICPVDQYAQQTPAREIDDAWDYFEQTPGYTCSYLAKFDLGATRFAPSARAGGVPLGKDPWAQAYTNDTVVGVSSEYVNCRKINQVKVSQETMLFDDAYFFHLQRGITHRNIAFVDGHIGQVADDTNRGIAPQNSQLYRQWYFFAWKGAPNPTYVGHP